MENINSANLYIVILSLLIACIAVVVILLFRLSIRKTISEAQNEFLKSNNKLIDKIGEKLSPSIVHCASEVDVAREAVLMMNNAIEARRKQNLLKEKKEKQTTRDTQKNEENPFITFYGAADLGTPITAGLNDADLEHFKAFNEVLSKAVDFGVRVRRHINLFTKQELLDRTVKAKSDYIKWLITRYEFLVSHPSFELQSNPRVPQWGTSFSSLLTLEGILEIKANGLSGIAIYHPNISRDIRENLVQARDMANPDRQKRIRSSDPESLDEFFNYILECCTWCNFDIKKTSRSKPVFYSEGSNFEFKLKKT